MEDSINLDAANTIVTTYGALAPGQQYRLPGEKHWYRRSAKARMTDDMSSRVVEIVSESR